MRATFVRKESGASITILDVTLVIQGEKEGEDCWWVSVNTPSEVHEHQALLWSEYELMNVSDKK